jgi:hypothetical protein
MESSADRTESLTRWKFWTQVVLLAVPLGCVAAWLVTSWRWPLVGDTALMRYVVLLMQHGFAPYRQIVEMNLPGSYIAEDFAMHLFGRGAQGSRLFDFSLLMSAAIAMLAMVWRSKLGAGSRYAAVFAAAMFALLHARDGIAQANQRDLIVAVLWLIAIAFLFAWVNGGVRAFLLWTVAAFGFCAAAPITLKPTAAPFLLVFFVVGVMQARRIEVSPARWLAFAVAGAALPIIAVLALLLHAHALSAFWSTLLYLDSFHRNLDAPSLFNVLGALAPGILRPVLLVWIVTAIALQRWRPWPGRWAYGCLFAAAALGLLSYLLQWKGFTYHRYPFFAFALLLCSIDFTAAFRRRAGWLPVIGMLGLGLLAFSVAPRSLVQADSYDNRPDTYLEDLKADLSTAGGASLSGNVQCLDMFSGCVNALYDLRLVQSTGMFYDCYVFSPHQTPYTLALREEFLGELQARPPRVMVLTSQLCFKGPHGFGKVDNWPEFRSFLNDRYALALERTPEPNAVGWNPPDVPYSYRIYKLR